jgi:hypothetical protein
MQYQQQMMMVSYAQAAQAAGLTPAHLQHATPMFQARNSDAQSGQ